jgi:transcriptional regulator with XRE-family HTH domain
MYANPKVGSLVKDWRHRRRRSQMDLALDVGVSPRHLSFIETGRSNPSPELLLALADRLDVPFRERNTLLLAAGYAPRYSQTALDDPALARIRNALQRMLDSHDPYPGIVIDRMWNAVLVNDAARRLAASLPPALSGPPLNVFRACLHPMGFASRTTNFAEWSAYLLAQLHRLHVLTADPAVSLLVQEVTQYPNIVALNDRRHSFQSEEPLLLVPWRLTLNDVPLSFFMTVTVFGTPQAITLAELAVELFYPADEVTEAALSSSTTPGIP